MSTRLLRYYITIFYEVIKSIVRIVDPAAPVLHYNIYEVIKSIARVAGRRLRRSADGRRLPLRNESANRCIVVVKSRRFQALVAVKSPVSGKRPSSRCRTHDGPNLIALVAMHREFDAELTMDRTSKCRAKSRRAGLDTRGGALHIRADGASRRGRAGAGARLLLLTCNI